MSQYIIHAAPYSSPNSSKRIKSNWAVQNLKVFQENPNAGGGVFAKFDLVNTSNPKDKKYMMQFSFADTTSMTSNAINRIRKFFDTAYDRQRNSSYGFPQLSDTEKTQIVARINTAYNQFAGFSHSSEDADVIDCRHSYIEHKASTAAIYSRRYGPNNEGIITLQRDRGGIHDFVVTLKNNGSTGQFYVRDTSHKPDIERSLNLLANTPKVSKCIEKDEVSNVAGTILVLRQEAMDFGKNQHEGYYSPNLQHSDYLSVKMSAIDDLDDNYLEHHGVKGQKWGVINDKPTDPRQRTRSSSGHPYYSPNTGNSSNSTNSVIKRDTNPGKNTSTSTKKTYYTADLSQKPLSDKDGVHYVIGIGNSGYGAQITVQSNVITSTLDRKEDLAAMVKNQVIQGIDSFRDNPRYGEPYKNLYLTDKQIDSIVWSLVYKIEKDWKKNYYKPGNY